MIWRFLTAIILIVVLFNCNTRVPINSLQENYNIEIVEASIIESLDQPNQHLFYVPEYERLIFSDRVDGQFRLISWSVKDNELTVLTNSEELQNLGFNDRATMYSLSYFNNSIIVFPLSSTTGFQYDIETGEINHIELNGMSERSSNFYFLSDNNGVHMHYNSEHKDFLFHSWRNGNSTSHEYNAHFPVEDFPETEESNSNPLVKRLPVFTAIDQSTFFVAYRYSSLIYKSDLQSESEKIIKSPYDVRFPWITEPVTINQSDGSEFQAKLPIFTNQTTYTIAMTSDEQYVYVISNSKSMEERLLSLYPLEESIGEVTGHLLENSGEELLMYDLDSGSFVGKVELPFTVYGVAVSDSHLFFNGLRAGESVIFKTTKPLSEDFY